MPKITKFISIYVLAFFIFGALLWGPSNAQDIKILRGPELSNSVKSLDNGLRVIIREDHRNPIVVFSAFIRTGSATEGEYLGSGISHLTEHMLFKGTEKYPPGAIENILHKYGGMIEGFTSYDYTGFRITILKGHKDIALDILKEMISNPAFDKKELKKEKEVIEREMDLGRDDPEKRISNLTFSSAYTRHPYRIPVIGYRENFERLTRDDLVRFFDLNYAPEKLILAIVGDIDREEIFGDMQDIFGKIPRGRNSLVPLPAEPPQAGQRYVEEKMDIEGAYINIAFHSASLPEKDLYALDVLSFMLGQGESSILNEEIRIKKRLANSITCYNYTPGDAGLFIISAILKKGKVRKALAGILKELDSIKEKGVTKEDLIKARNNFIADYTYQKETIESMANDLALGELLTGNPGFFETYITRIRAVTLEEIRDAARQYLNRDNMTVVVLSKTGDTLSSAPEQEIHTEKRTIKKIVLKNKLPVLISRNPSLPIVSISLIVRGGLRFETRIDNGISELASLMLMDGTDTMSRKEIAQYCESKGMTVHTYSANNSMGISINCLKKDAGEAMRVLSDLYANSIFPEKELTREKNETKLAIEMQDNSIFNYGHRLLKGLLFKDHPYGLQKTGTRESVDGITREGLLTFWKDISSTDNMVLGICGDYDTNEMIGLVKLYFSGMPLRKLTIPPPQEEPPMRGIREKTVKVERKQSLVLAGFRGIDIYSKDRYALEIMVDMLSSESGILFKNIRENSGLSYAQGAFQVTGIDPGYIAIYVLTSKAKIDTVKDIIFGQLRSFIKRGASPEELEESKNHLKAMRQIGFQTNASFIFSACLDELYGLGYDNYEDYEKNIDEVTAGDVKRAAGDLLTLERYAIVTLEGVI